MELEFVLGLLPVGITAVMAILGVAVTFFPPETRCAKLSWLTAFILLASAGAGASVWQSLLTRESQQSAKKETENWRGAVRTTLAVIEAGQLSPEQRGAITSLRRDLGIHDAVLLRLTKAQHLTDAQRVKLKALLGSIQQPSRIEVVADPASQDERIRLRDDFVAVFEAAHWPVKVGDTTAFPEPASGVSVVARNDEPAGTVLAAVLDEVVPPVTRRAFDGEPGHVVILIGGPVVEERHTP
jgi:hypothetical protein